MWQERKVADYCKIFKKAAEIKVIQAQKELKKTYMRNEKYVLFKLIRQFEKYSLNKNVFNSVLKTSIDADVRRYRGRRFHSLGAWTEKALSPKVLSLVLGTTRRLWSTERRDLVGWYLSRSSLRYWGARPCSAFYASTRTLYSIRLEMGSQCKYLRVGVMCWYFCTNNSCSRILHSLSFETDFLDRPAKSALQ